MDRAGLQGACTGRQERRRTPGDPAAWGRFILALPSGFGQRAGTGSGGVTLSGVLLPPDLVVKRGTGRGVAGPQAISGSPLRGSLRR